MGAASASVLPQSIEHHPLRVLLVDDDMVFRQVVAERLRLDGFDVLEARDGRNALAQVLQARDAQRPFDVVLSDMSMPNGDGVSLLWGLRLSGVSLPVIFMTGGCDDRQRADARRLGAFTVFDKPFDFDRMRSTFERAVAARD